MLELTECQKTAFDYIINNLKTKKVILLEGSAGTGKTTLTKNICNFYLENKNINICAIAPTHKSKKIIQNVLNKNTILPIPALTIASALGKVKEHSYIGTKKFSNGCIEKLAHYGLFIIDEVSMINDSDLFIIIDYVIKSKKQLLIIGDSNQIPCPSNPFIITNIVEKADSFIFTNNDIVKLKLTQIVRQVENSPIIKIATYLRNNLLNDLTFSNIIEDTKFDNIINSSNIYNVYIEHFDKNNINSCKIIAYTNNSVKTHNLEIRNILEYDEDFVVGEFLTGYNNVGWPDIIIENGEDYLVQDILKTFSHTIGKYNKLAGKLLTLCISDTKILLKNIFILNIHNEANNRFMEDLIKLGEKLNESGSTKKDYRNYMELKNCVIFIEDIYKYNGIIYSEKIFKEKYPLLFISVSEVIIDKKIKVSILSEKLNTEFPYILENRINDTWKQIADSEVFADKFKVIEKDIYYGYSITAHKSQASTYDTVIVDEKDFEKIKNKWNYKYAKIESRIKEKNQLRYVSYTRAKNNLYIFNNEIL